jgi:hypothetical protein
MSLIPIPSLCVKKSTLKDAPNKKSDKGKKEARKRGGKGRKRVRKGAKNATRQSNQKKTSSKKSTHTIEVMGLGF